MLLIRLKESVGSSAKKNERAHSMATQMEMGRRKIKALHDTGNLIVACNLY